MDPYRNQKVVMPRPKRGENDAALIAQAENNFSLGIKPRPHPVYANQNVQPNDVIQGRSFSQVDNQSGGPTNPDEIPTTGSFERKYSSTLQPERDPQSFSAEDQADAPQLAQFQLEKRLKAMRNGEITNYNNHQEIYR